MRHLSPRLLALAALCALPACSSNYHPEYHPVAVSNFSQNIAYPASQNGAGVVSPVYVLPASPVPQAALGMPSPALPADAPPPDFFR
jgi:hypothetical protein